MILSVCLSPCLEVNIEVDSLAVGRNNKVLSKRTFLTGRALNVAIGLSRLGADAFATGIMYEENGRMFEQQLHKDGVTYKFVWNQGRVKEVYKFIDRRSMLTEIDDDATPVTEANKKAIIETVAELSKKCQAVVITDDEASGLSDEFLCKIMSVIPSNVLKIVDTNGDKIVKLLDYGVDLVKPNLEELQRATNVKITDKESMLRSCQALIKRGAKRVLLSLGKNGAVIMDEKQRLYCMSLNVPMNTTAGAGDAMVAAATKSLCESAKLSDILKCGVAAGTASVTLPDSISFTKDKYEEILKVLQVKEI